MECCGICGVASSLKCSSCGKQSYCGKEHQRQHWPQHRMTCRNQVSKPIIEEKQNDLLGRHLVAVSDIPEETVLFRDTPLVVGPPSGSPPLCLACLRPEVTSSCPQCGVPLCQPRCKHSGPECESIQNAGSLLDAVKHSECILPLRCLLNVRYPKELWKEFLKLEAHLDVRRRLPVWVERNVRVVQVLRNHNLAASDGSDDELIQRICGVLDVNSFEVRGADGGILRAVYTQAALMAHSCIANVHVAVDENLVMTVRAARAIKKGETLFYCYTSTLQDTAARQEHLWQGKYFRCQCQRCQDPSELGTHLGSVWCPRCIVGLVCPGQFDRSSMCDIVSKAKSERHRTFRDFPIQWRPCKGTLRSSALHKQNHNNSLRVSWRCSDCKYIFPGAMIRTVYQVAMDTVDAVTSPLPPSPSKTVDRLEKLIKRLQTSLPPLNAVILHAKQMLGGAYRELISSTLRKGTSVNTKLLNKSKELYRELATVLERLECGAINRNVGLALHSLYEPLLLTMLSRNAKGNEAVEGFSEIREVLVSALRHLRIEPLQSPEGRLVSAALKQLADVQERLDNLQQSMTISKKSRRKKKG